MKAKSRYRSIIPGLSPRTGPVVVSWSRFLFVAVNWSHADLVRFVWLIRAILGATGRCEQSMRHSQDRFWMSRSILLSGTPGVIIN